MQGDKNKDVCGILTKQIGFALILCRLLTNNGPLNESPIQIADPHILSTSFHNFIVAFDVSGHSMPSNIGSREGAFVDTLCSLPAMIRILFELIGMLSRLPIFASFGVTLRSNDIHIMHYSQPSDCPPGTTRQHASNIFIGTQPKTSLTKPLIFLRLLFHISLPYNVPLAWNLLEKRSAPLTPDYWAPI